MLAIELRFPASLYHATPWGRHVNEAEVEWPPSPWRFARALLATWHHKAADDLSESTVRSLIDKLCTALPRYDLPAVTGGHTRHYMPLYNSVRDDKTARVFDAFLHVPPTEPVRMTWSGVMLDATEEAALSLLLSRLGYLGRAESWVEASLSKEAGEGRCRPLLADGSDADGELVRLLVPQSPQSYIEWRTSRNGTSGKRGKKGVEVADTLFDALHVETADLRKAGWSQPPGSVYLEYVRPREGQVSSKSATVQPVTVARYAVASPVPPLLTQAISFAERVHKTLVDKSNGLEVFRGTDDARRPLTGHRHAYILCEANSREHDKITHVTLFTTSGFDATAQAALGSVEHVYGRSGHIAHLVLLGIGSPPDFAGTNVRAGQCALFARRKVWRSLTPFVSTRHPKPRKFDAAGRIVGSPAHDLCRLLREQGFPEPVSVEELEGTRISGHQTRWLEFRTMRYDGEGTRSTNRGCGFRIEFPSEVAGPIAVGYGAHFGLGVFVPDLEFDSATRSHPITETSAVQVNR